jgi:hypothetical protein
VAAALLSLGSPLVPSKEERLRLRKLWKKPVPTPIDGLLSGSGKYTTPPRR